MDKKKQRKENEEVKEELVENIDLRKLQEQLERKKAIDIEIDN